MKISKPIVVIDTNVFLVSILPHFSYYWIYEKLLNNKYELLLTNEILMEYEEQIALRYGVDKTEAELDFLLLLPNVKRITPFYHWNLITADVDDNKFVDCAVSGNADFIVTQDKHFNVLKQIDFPRIKVLDINGFKTLLSK